MPPTPSYLPAKSFGLVIDVPGVTARSLAFDVLSPLEHLTGREAVNGCLRPDYVESVVVKSSLRVPTIVYLQWDYLEIVDVSSTI